MNAAEMYTQLLSLRNSTGEIHYQRIAMADKLLKDHTWVEAKDGGGGDENKAIDRLEEECFGDLCGAISLPQMLEIYHHIPNISDWRAAKFNLSKLWANWKQKQKGTVVKPRARRSAPKGFVSPYDFSELTPSRQLREYERVVNRLDIDDDKIARLEVENDHLRAENRLLRSQIAQLQKVAG